jgi:uncharacterized protein YndB with AHSA1/START domain
MFVSTKTATKFIPMETKNLITVQASISAPVEKVWKAWTEPQHITQWNQASPDWHCPNAENDLRAGGKFSATMAARDGSMSFDFGGVYSKVEQHKVIESALGDGRTIKTQFVSTPTGTQVTETFEAESENSLEMQRAGWQAILDNFRQYTEKLK